MRYHPRTSQTKRRGVAALELAVMLPLLAFLAVIAVDFGRIYYYAVSITNAA